LFAFRLALALGYPHPDYLLRMLSSTQFNEWLAYAALEPFGEERADLRAGIVASTLANVNRRKGQRALKPRDFMPKFGKRVRREQTWQEQLQIAKMWAAAVGGVVAPGRPGPLPASSASGGGAAPLNPPACGGKSYRQSRISA
jgi:hypothetical protein